MRITKRGVISDFEKSLIDAVLVFGNVRIKSATQVEAIFAPLAAGAFPSIADTNPDGGPFKNDQRQLRRWLYEIAQRGENARTIIGDEVRQLLLTVPVRVDFKDEHRIFTFGSGGVQAVISHAVAILLSKPEGLTNRVGWCPCPKKSGGHGIEEWDIDAPYCGKFRVTYTGRPRRYCSNQHKAIYDRLKAPERMKAWRVRQAMDNRKGRII